MAIQTIYTQVDNANISPCHKGKPFTPIAIPLIRNNYLSEYKTQNEKDKVLRNLGILGVTNRYTYPAEQEVSSYKDIKTVQQALDYCIRLIKSYQESDESIKQLLKDVTTLQNDLTKLSTEVNANTTSIETITQDIVNINNSIADFNQKLKDLNVDDKITNRINQHLANSKTIELVEDTLETKQSNEENNAIIAKDDGLFVNDLGTEVNANTEAINQLQDTVKDSDKYKSGTKGESPYTVGGIKQGTTVDQLNGKSISDILDMMLFPVYVRNLVQPRVSYSTIPKLVEIGSEVIKPTLTFIQNDAGKELSREEVIQYKGNTYAEGTYTSIGQYNYTGTITYDNGEYLIDSKGETTNTRVDAGTISTQISTIATYPWYIGNVSQLYKQVLVAFDVDSDTYTISLSGKSIIKLPGANTELRAFKVDGGLGYLDVDLDGWVQSVEYINGFPYKVWTKDEPYSTDMSHQIKFKLVQ